VFLGSCFSLLLGALKYLSEVILFEETMSNQSLISKQCLQNLAFQPILFQKQCPKQQLNIRAEEAQELQRNINHKGQNEYFKRLNVGGKCGSVESNGLNLYSYHSQ